MRDRGPTPPGGRPGSPGGASYTAVGRRKRAVARVLLQPGNGNIIVNGAPLEQRFPRATHQAAITLPLRLTNRLGSMNVLAKVGTPAQKEKWLRPLVEGKVRSAFVMTEPHPGSGSDPGMMLTRAAPNSVTSGTFNNRAFKSQSALSTAAIAMEQIPGRPRLRMLSTIRTQHSGTDIASRPAICFANRSWMS